MLDQHHTKLRKVAVDNSSIGTYSVSILLWVEAG